MPSRSPATPALRSAMAIETEARAQALANLNRTAPQPNRHIVHRVGLDIKIVLSMC
jgi:hypothetical protein